MQHDLRYVLITNLPVPVAAQSKA